jgi:cytochrome c553
MHPKPHRPMFSVAIAAAATMMLAAPVFASSPIAPGARLAATCTGCHGTNGATTGKALPPLAGQSKEALLASRQAFKSGARSATIMTQITKGYSDEQLAQLAAFFAAQAAKPQGDRP